MSLMPVGALFSPLRVFAQSLPHALQEAQIDQEVGQRILVTVQETSEFFKNSEVSYSSLAPQSHVYFLVLGRVGIVFTCKISVISVPLWR